MNETIRRGMAFLLEDHLKWFKGPPDTLLDENGRTQMPWVYYSNLQHNGAPFKGSVDRFVSYPAFHHALLIRTFLGCWRYAKDTRALEEAVKLANWNIAHSTPGDWPYGNVPYSTFQEKKPGGFRDKTGLMPDFDCLDTIRYLLANRTDTNGYLDIAKELNAWIEKVFLDKIKGFEPAEGIREQLACNVVMGIHSLNWASMLLELAKATGDRQLCQRAMQTANYITYYLQPDNRLVVGFNYDQWWYSCHAGAVLYLLDFVKQ
jgi:hypothetical protein